MANQILMPGDINKLVGCVQLLPTTAIRSPQGWNNPSLNLIDCVLASHQKYERTVRPRLKNFKTRHPEIRSLANLSQLVSHCGGEADFFEKELVYRDPRKATTFYGILNYLKMKECLNAGKSELENLGTWAKSFSQSDYLNILPMVDCDKVKGFGFTGFQYLRILFGADCVKPDKWIRKFVDDCLGRRISSGRKVAGLLETASIEAGYSPREVDGHIWRRDRERR